MNKNNYIEWSKVKSLIAICDEIDSVLELEQRGRNTLYSPITKKEYWFNNALTPYVYVGLCLFICTDSTTCILDRYEVLEVTTEEE